jgi:hypothetical protein
LKNSPGSFFFMTVVKILEHVRHLVVDGMVVVADRMVGPTGAVNSCLAAETAEDACLAAGFFLLRS